MQGEMRMYRARARREMDRSTGRAIAVLFGKNGLAWGIGLAGQSEAGLRKKERDGRAPAGVFRIGQIYTYDAQLPPGSDYPFHQVTEADIWSDDPRSPNYNRHVVIDPKNPPDNYSHERMRSGDFAYHWLIEIRHNSDPPVPGEGSAIFFHIRRGVSRATAGCTTMAEENLVRVIQWLRSRKTSLLRAACRRRSMTAKWQSWNLPPPSRDRIKIKNCGLRIARRNFFLTFVLVRPKLMKKRANPDSEANIRRIDSKSKAKKQTHGFQVHFLRGREAVTRMFSDTVYGGKEIARRAARKFKRDAMRDLPERIFRGPISAASARAKSKSTAKPKPRPRKARSGREVQEALRVRAARNAQDRFLSLGFVWSRKAFQHSTNPGAKSPGRASSHARDDIGWKKFAEFDLASRQIKRAVVLPLVEPDKFLPGRSEAGSFSDPPSRGHSQLFLQLSARCLVVFFARIDVSGGARIPGQWVPVLPARPFLQKNLPCGVEKQDVNGPMPQVIPMHFPPRRCPDDAVRFVDHRKGSESSSARVLRAIATDEIGQGDPLLKTQFLRPGLSGPAPASPPPPSLRFLEAVFPSCFRRWEKPVPHEVVKRLESQCGQFFAKSRAKANKRRVDLGTGNENACRDGPQKFASIMQLDHKSESAVVFRPRSG